MKHYLIVWGGATSSIRIGEGKDEKSAAYYAFGSYSPERMTCIEASSRELQTAYIRSRLIYELLELHAHRIESEMRHVKTQSEGFWKQYHIPIPYKISLKEGA